MVTRSEPLDHPPASPVVTLADLLAVPALAGARIAPERADLTIRVRSLATVGAEPGAVPFALLAGDRVPAATPPGCCVVIARRLPDVLPGVPVLVLRDDAKWGRAVSEVAALLSTSPGLAASTAARAAFREPLLRGGGYAGLAEATASLIGAPVACLDEYLDVLGSAGLDAERHVSLRGAIERARGHGPASVVGPFLEEGPAGALRFAVMDGREPAGVVVLWQRGADVETESIVSELAEACLIERSRQRIRAETEARLRGDFLDELRAGEGLSGESVVRRARHLGSDLAGGAVAVTGSLQDPHDVGRLITEPRLVRRFLQRAHSIIEMHWMGALLDWNDGRLCLFLPSRPGVDAAQTEEAAVAFGERLLAATAETVPGLALTVAFSRYTPDPARLGRALEEAELALSIGERLGRIGQVVTFEETGVYKLLFRLLADRPGELRDFYAQTIGPLVEYDAGHSTELVRTLATYLVNDGNLAVTAGELFTHRHTVRYRLDRIAELTGLDISRTDDREMLSLGLKVMRLLGRRSPGTLPVEHAERRPARRAS